MVLRQTVHPAAPAPGQGSIPRPAVLALGRLHPAARGAASGLVFGLWGLLLTAWTAAAGGGGARGALALLAQYLPGYHVSASGAILALGYGAAAGFAAGFVFAFVRNLLLRTFVQYLRRRAEQEQLSDVLDRIN